MKVIYPKACGVDVHKSFIVAVICDSTGQTTKYSKKRFLLLITRLFNLENGYSKTTVKMYVWNPLASIIFQYTMH